MSPSHQDERSGPTEFAWPTLYVPITEIGPTKFMWSVTPRLRYVLTLARQSHRVDCIGPTKKPNVHILTWIGLTEF